MRRNFKQNGFSKKDKGIKLNDNEIFAEDYSRSVSDYFVDLSKIKTLTKEEEKEILKNGKTPYAKKRLIEGNLKFVFKVAKFFRGKCNAPMADLIEEGNEGLFYAFDKFDPSKGFRFYCYAVWWIKAYINAYVKNISSINEKRTYVPIGYENKQNYDNQDADADFEDIKLVDFDDSDYTEDGLLKNDGLDDFDIDKDVDYENDNDVICCDNETISKKEDNEVIKFMSNIGNNISDIELKVINSYYGINSDKKTLKEIGQDLNYSISFVKKIRDNALAKLKKSALKNQVLVDMYC